MKIFILCLLISSSILAYDGEIKDSRGRTIGYVNDNKDSISIYDTKGRKEFNVNDLKITDEKGKTYGEIKWND
ncbi:MAG: hypothetical protein GY756_03825 [bacterium]|nr:hypothetical protein [bacterium]